MANRVRARREQLGITQKELAARAEMSRQTLNSIEAERQAPSVTLALRLARLLSTQVEALFSDPAAGQAPQTTSQIEATLVGRLRGQVTRVLACELRGRWIAHPVGSRQPALAADGVSRAAPASRGRVRVELTSTVDQLRENLLIAGASPVLSALCERLNRTPGPGHFRSLALSQRAAFTALARGHVHMVGVQLTAAQLAEPCRAFARHLPAASAQLVALATSTDADGGPVGLIIPDDIRDARVERLRAMLCCPTWHHALRALGYDARCSGQELTRISVDGALQPSSCWASIGRVGPTSASNADAAWSLSRSRPRSREAS